MYELKNINKKYYHQVIFDDLNITIKNSEITLITGPSGSGKTTLLNILGALQTIDSGEVLYNEEKLVKPFTNNAKKYYRYDISFIFQNYGLVEELTVKQNLKLALKYEKDDHDKLIEFALKKVNLEEKKNEKVKLLSGGEKQRVAIAKALIKPSKVILADEPTGNLDIENRDIIINLLLELKKSGKTVIIVSHDPEFINYADQVISLK